MRRSLAFPTAAVVVLVASLTLGCRDRDSAAVHAADRSIDPAASVCGDVVPDHAPDAIGEFEHGYSIPARGNGLRQSPIDIRTRELADGEHDVTLHYEASGEHVRNMGHTVQVRWDAGSWVTFDGVRYEFVQLHFHTPSEHKVDGVTYPLEAHLVHVEADTAVEEPRYLVVGILFREGRDHPFLRHVLDDAPEGHGGIVDHPEHRQDVSELLGDGLAEYFHYTGSLTTPPYTETVQWLVAGRPYEAGPEQIQKLNRLEGNNARHIQDPEGRVIERARLDSRDRSGNE